MQHHHEVEGQGRGCGGGPSFEEQARRWSKVNLGESLIVYYCNNSAFNEITFMSIWLCFTLNLRLIPRSW